MPLEYSQYKNDATLLENFLLLKLSAFFRHLHWQGKMVAISKLWSFSTELRRSYIDFTLVHAKIYEYLCRSCFLFIGKVDFQSPQEKQFSYQIQFFLRKKANFLWKTHKKNFRYSGVGKISKIPLFCRILLNKKLVIRKVSAIAGFSAKFFMINVFHQNNTY